MTEDMLRRLRVRLNRRHTARQMATWRANMEAASRWWNRNVTAVPLSAWQAAMAYKSLADLSRND